VFQQPHRFLCGASEPHSQFEPKDVLFAYDIKQFILRTPDFEVILKLHLAVDQ